MCHGREAFGGAPWIEIFTKVESAEPIPSAVAEPETVLPFEGLSVADHWSGEDELKRALTPTNAIAASLIMKPPAGKGLLRSRSKPGPEKQHYTFLRVVIPVGSCKRDR
jgi:hypothetical protein